MSRLSRTPELAKAWDVERTVLDTGSASLHIFGLCFVTVHIALSFPDFFFMALGFAFGVLALPHGIACLALDAFHERYPEASSLRGDDAYEEFLQAKSQTDALAFLFVWTRSRLKRLFWELALIMVGLALLLQL